MIGRNDPEWLLVHRGTAPLVVSVPHAGTALPPDIEANVASPWLARKDTDWWIDHLYDFAEEIGATTIRTMVSRTVIDVNRDPSGASLYPGQATTELVPTTTFDGEPLWRAGHVPDAIEIARRQERYFAPYHRALADEIARLRGSHPRVVLYDCHSIRSVIPRLFEGQLPIFNIGTNSGRSCATTLADSIAATIWNTGQEPAVDGRFKGGYITRHYGRPADGVHAVQMELACRGYIAEPIGAADAGQWPVAYDPAFAAPIRAVLKDVLVACLHFANQGVS